MPISPEDIRRGATIKELRHAYGLTTDQLGKAAGVSGNYIYMVESGRRSAPLRLCRKIAEVLQVSLAAITIEDYRKLAAGVAEDQRVAAQVEALNAEFGPYRWHSFASDEGRFYAVSVAGSRQRPCCCGETIDADTASGLRDLLTARVPA